MRHMQATTSHRRARLSAPAGITTVGDGAGAVGVGENTAQVHNTPAAAAAAGACESTVPYPRARRERICSVVTRHIGAGLAGIIVHVPQKKKIIVHAMSRLPSGVDHALNGD